MTDNQTIVTHCGIILLAAGASTRLGRPKQLLPYNSGSLLQHAIQVAHESKAHPLVVVLGAHADLLLPGIDQKMTLAITNTKWEEGMASSIVYGLKALVKMAPLLDGAILMVCDQPYITTSLLNDLIITQQKTGKLIITSSYEGTPGPPALFHKSIFPELLQLEGDTGARKIVQRHADEAGTVLFPKGTIDIDTEADYEVFLGTELKRND